MSQVFGVGMLIALTLGMFALVGRELGYKVAVGIFGASLAGTALVVVAALLASGTWRF